jgi:chromosome segregation ATPase
MSTIKDQQPEADRIAQLEAQVDRLNRAEDAKRREIETLKRLELPSPPQPTQLAREIGAVQDRALEGRRRAHEAQSAAYELQLERVAPERERLELQLAELDGSLCEIEERHQAAVARVTAAQQVVRRQLAKLLELPPMPAVDVAEGRRVKFVGRAFGREQHTPVESGCPR